MNCSAAEVANLVEMEVAIAVCRVPFNARLDVASDMVDELERVMQGQDCIIQCVRVFWGSRFREVLDGMRPADIAIVLPSGFGRQDWAVLNHSTGWPRLIVIASEHPLAQMPIGAPQIWNRAQLFNIDPRAEEDPMDRLARDIRLLALAGALGPARDHAMRLAVFDPVAACAALRATDGLGRWARRVARRALRDHEQTTTVIYHKGKGGRDAGGAVVTVCGASGSGNPSFDRPVQNWNRGLLRFTIWNIGLLPDAPEWMRQATQRTYRVSQ